MMRFKSCPKCQTGDMVLDRDTYGSYMRCLQCGFLRYQALPTVLEKPRVRKLPVDSAT
jgi:ssDNA-binding Zn-finger/Zn-ribbon topoisomerase 1